MVVEDVGRVLRAFYLHLYREQIEGGSGLGIQLHGLTMRVNSDCSILKNFTKDMFLTTGVKWL